MNIEKKHLKQIKDLALKLTYSKQFVQQTWRRLSSVKLTLIILG